MVLSKKIFSKKAFIGFLVEKWFGTFFSYFPGYNMSVILVISLIYYVRKIFGQVLDSPSILEHRYKMSETRWGITTSCGDSQTE